MSKNEILAAFLGNEIKTLEAKRDAEVQGLQELKMPRAGEAHAAVSAEHVAGLIALRSEYYAGEILETKKVQQEFLAKAEALKTTAA